MPENDENPDAQIHSPLVGYMTVAVAVLILALVVFTCIVTWKMTTPPNFLGDLVSSGTANSDLEKLSVLAATVDERRAVLTQRSGVVALALICATTIVMLGALAMCATLPRTQVEVKSAGDSFRVAARLGPGVLMCLGGTALIFHTLSSRFELQLAHPPQEISAKYIDAPNQTDLTSVRVDLMRVSRDLQHIVDIEFAHLERTVQSLKAEVEEIRGQVPASSATTNSEAN